MKVEKKKQDGNVPKAIKFTFENNVRKYIFTKQDIEKELYNSYEFIVGKVIDIFNAKQHLLVSFKYKDDEDDLITVGNSRELVSAYDLYINSIGKILKLQVLFQELKEQKKPKKPEIPLKGVNIKQQELILQEIAKKKLKQVVTKVQKAPSNYKLQEICRKYKLELVNVDWQDVGRSKNSCVGPNISDMTLNVSGSNMPILRSPNFFDETMDIDMKKIKLVVGNDRGDDLSTISLDNFLKNIEKYTDVGSNTNLYAGSKRDSHVLVSAQSCYLPIMEGLKSEFNINIYNYQSTYDNPAVLALTVTSKGTSAQILGNGNTSLDFNDNGKRKSFIGQRLKDNRKERNVQIEGKMSKEEKQDNVICVIQTPLKRQSHRHRSYIPGWGYQSIQYQGQQWNNNNHYGGCGQKWGNKQYDGYSNNNNSNLYSASSPSYSYKKKCVKPSYNIDSFCELDDSSNWRGGNKKQEKSDVDHVMVGLGKSKGKFPSLYGKKLVRDTKFPIRVTLQYYKATSNGVIDKDNIKDAANQLLEGKKHADAYGSLVTENQNRPTEIKKAGKIQWNIFD